MEPQYTDTGVAGIVYPLHVEVEVLLEQMATLDAHLSELERPGSAEADWRAVSELQSALRRLRFNFDPYNRNAVLAMAARIGRYADALDASSPG